MAIRQLYWSGTRDFSYWQTRDRLGHRVAYQTMPLLSGGSPQVISYIKRVSVWSRPPSLDYRGFVTRRLRRNRL